MTEVDAGLFTRTSRDDEQLMSPDMFDMNDGECSLSSQSEDIFRAVVHLSKANDDYDDDDDDDDDDKTYMHTYIHPFNGPLSGTTLVSRYQKGKTSLYFTGARDSEWQWHQLGHMQICTSSQVDNHASTSPLSFFTVQMPSMPPIQQRQSSEGMMMMKVITIMIVVIIILVYSDVVAEN